MPSQIIACDDCAAARLRFEREGYRVTGCAPHPDRAGSCVLEFEPAPAAGEDESGAASCSNADPAVARTIARPDSALTPTQVRTALAIVNLFETGHVLGDHGQVTLLPGDPGRLTYGRSQATLGSGMLERMLRRYADNPGARFGDAVRHHLPAIAQASAGCDTDLRLHNLLRACADDPVMRETQDLLFDECYWRPAERAAVRLGLHSALAAAVVYDSHVHGSWGRLRGRTEASIGSVAQAGEKAWIARYVDQRREWLATHTVPILRRTVYRMDAFRRLIELGQWGLGLPLVVRGTEISLATLNATPPGCYDGPVPGVRALQVERPMLCGLDARLLQLALCERGAEIVADGVYGNASARCVKQFQLAHGLPATGVADVGLIAQLVP